MAGEEGVSKCDDAVQADIDRARVRKLSPRFRYQHDPMFHQLVDTIRGLLDQCEMTPSEVRQAAVLACQIHEETSVRLSLPAGV